MKQELDMAIKLAGAFNRLESKPKAGVEIKLFMVIDLAHPYELSIEDLERITSIPRAQIAPAAQTLTQWGYVQEKGGLFVRLK